MNTKRKSDATTGPELAASELRNNAYIYVCIYLIYIYISYLYATRSMVPDVREALAP
jgi:hypothetical protein